MFHIAVTYRNVDNNYKNSSQMLYEDNSIIKTNLSAYKVKLVKGSDLIALIKNNQSTKPIKVGIKVFNGSVEKFYGYDSAATISFTDYTSTNSHDSLYINWDDNYIETIERIQSDYLLMKFSKK